MKTYFGSADEPPDGRDAPPFGPGSETEYEFLPYRVEIWDETETFIEQVVALTRNQTVGWAAYLAAKEAFPNRTITLRDQHGELSRWAAKRH